jgi:hypothetical protein
VDNAWRCIDPDAGASDAKDAALAIAPDAPLAPDTARTRDTLDSRETGDTRGCQLLDAPYRYPFSCARGGIGSLCDDVTFPPQCIAGEWNCGRPEFGPPYVRADQCACFGIGPSQPGMRCVCGAQGWQCSPIDGGAVDTKDAALSDLRADL